jgi:hypothetical protein
MFGDAIDALQLMSPIFESDAAGIPAFRRSLELIGVYVHSRMPFIVAGIEARIDCRRSDSNVVFAQARDPPAAKMYSLILLPSKATSSMVPMFWFELL